MDRQRIAVIGAGLAGLLAAWRIRQNGFDVIVFEAREQVGGRACSIRDGGAVHDLGAWTFTAQGPVMRLVKELDLLPELVTIPTTVGRPVHGRLRVADCRRPLSLPGRVFNLRETLSIAKMMGAMRTSSVKAPDEPAASWAARSFSSAFIRDVLKPLAGLYFLQELKTLSRNAFLDTCRYLSSITLHSFRSGMGFLTASLAEGLPVRYGARVHNVRLADKTFCIGHQGGEEKVDGVIVATSLPDVVKLLKGYLSPTTLEAAVSWQYASALVVRLLLKGRWPRIALQVLPPRGHGWLSCGLTVERAKSASRVPKGVELVAMYARPDRVAALGEKSDEELAGLFACELERWLSIPQEGVEKYWVERWQHGAAFTDPGVPQRLAVLNKGFEQLAREVPIWTAGDFWGTSGLAGAVRSAERAAVACSTAFAAASTYIRLA